MSTNLYPFINNLTSSSQFDVQKRTRFSFKQDHLVILEKSFIDNPYPDQKKREELALLCNEARPCAEKDKVTEQVITHWFQNKRKINRKSSLDLFNYFISWRKLNFFIYHIKSWLRRRYVCQITQHNKF
jgi:hypothetical protein